MRKVLAVLAVCLMTTAASAQVSVAPTDALDDGWVYSPRTADQYNSGPDSAYITWNNPGQTMADDIHMDGPITMEGFEFSVYNNVFLPSVPGSPTELVATVSFYQNDPFCNVIYYPALASFTVTGLTTMNAVQYITVPTADTALPADLWMRVDYNANSQDDGVASRGGHRIARDAVQPVGMSHDWFGVFAPGYFGYMYGEYLAGLSWFGGYASPWVYPYAYNPPGNLHLRIYGIPEPMTLGLLAAGLTGLAAIRRRR